MQGFDDERPRRGRRVSPAIELAAIAAASIALMMADHAGDRLDPVRDTLAIALQPFRVAASLPQNAIATVSVYFDHGQLIRDNQRLEHQLLRLQGRLQKTAALEAENRRIRALLASARSLNRKMLIARIVAVSPDPYRQTVELNKGSRDGVFAGQALLDADGVMGQVVRVTPVNARAILISDPNHGIPVEINRTGLRTIAQGVGRTDALSLPFLADNADIRPGDLLVTSGLGGRYPAGYPVARVASVAHRAGEAFLDVSARPAAHLDRGREVLLVWNENAPAPGADEHRTPDARDDDHENAHEPAADPSRLAANTPAVRS